MSEYSRTFEKYIKVINNITNIDTIGLKPRPTNPISNKISVDPGTYRSSDGRSSITFSGGASPIFQPIVNLPRYDILCIDDNSIMHIIQGSESNNPTVPRYPIDMLTIAEVYIDEKNNVLIDNNDLKDVRDLLGPSDTIVIDGGSFI